MLAKGKGISPHLRPPLTELLNAAPSLMKELGFQQTNSEKLQWQRPEKREEFFRLRLVILGLYGNTESDIYPRLRP